MTATKLHTFDVDTFSATILDGDLIYRDSNRKLVERRDYRSRRTITGWMRDNGYVVDDDMLSDIDVIVAHMKWVTGVGEKPPKSTRINTWTERFEWSGPVPAPFTTWGIVIAGIVWLLGSIRLLHASLAVRALRH